MSNTHPLLKLLHHRKALGLKLVMPPEKHANPATLKNLADAIDDGDIDVAELEQIAEALYEAIEPT